MSKYMSGQNLIHGRTSSGIHPSTQLHCRCYNQISLVRFIEQCIDRFCPSDKNATTKTTHKTPDVICNCDENTIWSGQQQLKLDHSHATIRQTSNICLHHRHALKILAINLYCNIHTVSWTKVRLDADFLANLIHASRQGVTQWVRHTVTQWVRQAGGGINQGQQKRLLSNQG